MSRTFAYCRVSTSEQSTENQIMAIRQAGYEVNDNRVVSETVSGGVQAMQRKGFADMVTHKLEAGDQLVVLKLTAWEGTTSTFSKPLRCWWIKGLMLFHWICLCVTFPARKWKPMLQMFSAFAEFEKSRIIERTKEV